MARAPEPHDPAVKVKGRPDDEPELGALGHQPARGPEAPLPAAAPQPTATGTVTVSAPGAAPVRVQIAAEDEPEPTGTVNIVTTAKGVLNHYEGIAAVGTEAEIAIARFSSAWMRPAGAADKRKLVKAGKLEQD